MTQNEQPPAVTEDVLKENLKNSILSEINEIKEIAHPKKTPQSYTVQEIRDKKVIHRVTHYLVKWEGYPDDQCTWEPIKHLRNVNHLIREYECRQKPSPAERFKFQQRGRPPNDFVPPSQALKGSETKRPWTFPTPEAKIHALMKTPAPKPIPKPTQISSADVIILEPKPQKKIKLATPEQVEAAYVQKPIDKGEIPSLGHYQYGDTPKRITNGRFEYANDLGYFLCTVEWERRSNGVQPRSTPFTNIDLKLYDPMRLIEYYESLLIKKKPEEAPKAQ